MDSEDLSGQIRDEDLIQAIRNLTGEQEVKLCGVLNVKRATGGIEGFTSIVVRVKTSYRLRSDDSVHSAVFVVKTAPLEESQMEILRSCRVFIREGVYFAKVAPLMLMAAAGRVDVPLPLFYHGVYDGVNDALYMEDLAVAGYTTPKKSYLGKGFDMDHCIVAMRKLGIIHALGMAAEKLIPVEDGGCWLKAFPDLEKDAIIYDTKPGEPVGPYHGMVERGLEVVVKLSEQLDGLPREAVSSGAMEKVLKGYWSTLKRLVLPSKDAIQILCHGDYWINNIMFRYGNDGKPIEAKVIDLQLARICHPAIDITQFMFTSIRKCFRDQHFDEIVECYYNSLVETLKALDYGSPPMSLDDLKHDLRTKYKTFGVIVSAAFSPLMMLDEDFIPPNAEDMTKEKYDDFFKTGCSSIIFMRYAKDENYRANVDAELREFVNVILPHGLDRVECSPLLVRA